MSYRIEMMDRGHAVVVLPVDYSKGTVVLIRQPRFNVGFVVSPELRALQVKAAQLPEPRGLLRQTLSALGSLLPFRPKTTPDFADIPADTVLVHEMPAGMIDEGETPEQAVLRELHEETGILVNATRLTKVAAYFPSIGGTTERLTAYIADISGCVPDLTTAGEGEESIDVWEFTIQEMFDLLRDGHLESASSNILFRELQIQMLRGGYHVP
jgi:8-oxo-dGTP pyrophosphatase MutT (NUDIX family)